MDVPAEPRLYMHGLKNVAVRSSLFSNAHDGPRRATSSCVMTMSSESGPQGEECSITSGGAGGGGGGDGGWFSGAVGIIGDGGTAL